MSRAPRKEAAGSQRPFFAESSLIASTAIHHLDLLAGSRYVSMFSSPRMSLLGS
jgi:hypothetical protein